MGKSAQTPGSWLKGGAGGLWSAACKAALIACGINPDNFGDYDARARAQAAERKRYRDQRATEAGRRGRSRRPHEPSCPKGSDPRALCQCVETENALNEMGSERWMLANSQSGHISQNAFYQGHREDPCSNIPPTRGNSGTYGYQDNTAFCMDHQGRANNPGTMHYEITNREAAFAQHMSTSGASGVSQTQIEQGVTGTAQVATQGAQSRQRGNGPRWDPPGPVTADRRRQGQLSDQGRNQQAADLTARENRGRRAGASGRGRGRRPSSPSTRGPTAKQARKATECIRDAWRQSLNEMRDNVVNEHSTAGNSAECQRQLREHNASLAPGQPRARGYTDLPPARRRRVDAAVASQVTRRQQQLERAGAHNAGQTRSPHPTEDECLEYQANWLYNNRRANGTYPPLQGRVPDSGTTTTTSPVTRSTTRRR